MNPAVAAIVERVRDAHASGRPLQIRGGGTKDFYGEAPTGEVLDTSTLVGAADHEPTELVVTAPAGMALVDLEARGMTYAITYFVEQAYDLSGVELFEREVVPALVNRQQHSNLWHFIHGR